MVTDREDEPMPVVKRQIEENAQGYQEVTLEFRAARAAKLEARGVHLRTGRNRCPMVDASRTALTYGHKALPDTDRKALARWARALGLMPAPVKGIAYSSGPVYKGLYNLLRGEFNEDEINTGLIIRLKQGVNTGVLSTGQFDQVSFDKFVWSIRPSLKGTTIDRAFLHSDAAATLYVDDRSIHAIMAHNIMNAHGPRGMVGFGRSLSKFEMQRLLMGILGQDIELDFARPGKATRALSVRDMHDFYKYGVFPAPIEERLQAAGLIDVPTMIEVG
jgi:hypothetical protein